MKALTAAIVLVGLGINAHAAGFAPMRLSDSCDTCYRWEGGSKSAGSFSKCQPAVEVVVLTPLMPPPVQPSPVMMPLAAPVTCAPPPKPIVRKRKPAPPKC
jgi:hypothetical protein